MVDQVEMTDNCTTCRLFVEKRVDDNTKTFCVRRLHSGSRGSTPETKFDLRSGKNMMTGNRIEQIVSYFPETRPEWWCGEHEPAHAVGRA